MRDSNQNLKSGGKIIPNLLSGFRLLAAPIMLYLAWTGKPLSFLIMLAISLSTDAIDGFLARRLNWQSELGARLDSWGDFTTYITVPLGAWWLWPDILRREAFFCMVGHHCLCCTDSNRICSVSSPDKLPYLGRQVERCHYEHLSPAAFPD